MWELRVEPTMCLYSPKSSKRSTMTGSAHCGPLMIVPFLMAFIGWLTFSFPCLIPRAASDIPLQRVIDKDGQKEFINSSFSNRVDHA
nr:hypothetical protein [Candidatus Sigynarchaeota archaeon]